MAGRKITDNSKKIVLLILEGKSIYAIKKLGFSRETARYYWRKLKFPTKHRRVVAKIKALNRKRQSR